MADHFSRDRVFCSDYLMLHKKKIPYQRNFRKVEDIGLFALQKLLPKAARHAHNNDHVCQNCFRRLRDMLSSSNGFSAETADEFLPEEEKGRSQERCVNTPEALSHMRLEKLHAQNSKVHAEPRQLSSNSTVTVKCHRNVCNRHFQPSDLKCSVCAQWFKNFKQAYEACSSYQERMRLLTLLPSDIERRKLQALIPNLSAYMIYRSRRWRAKHGIWLAPNAVKRTRLNPMDVQAAMAYYSKDEYSCSRQSPNKKDVVSVIIDGKKELVSKTFMTHSVREAYRLFREANPNTSIGLSKFYSLRPKWVLLAPHQEVCLCIYCANATECVSALQDVTDGAYTADFLKELCLCSSPTSDCFLGHCDYCAKEDALTATCLGIPEDIEVAYAVWENGDLVKKNSPGKCFSARAKSMVREVDYP